MDQQHPIPQQISSYQFRLVGDMTLKQFFQLAGGALLSLLIYASGLHPVIKWPLILFFALSGVALAFLPFEDRPLDKWVLAFFRSVYSPTKYSWTKMKKRSYFQDEAAAPRDNIVAPQGKEEMEKYLSQRGAQKGPLSQLEQAEQAFLAKVSGLFGQQKHPQKQIVTVQQQARPQPQPQFQAQKPQHPQKPQGKDIKIPDARPVRVIAQEKGPAQNGEAAKQAAQRTQPQLTRVDPSAAKEKAQEEVQQAKFSVDASPPMPPTQANTISGQVMDPDGKIVEAAILEITDVSGRPVRAVKTNKLGHFYVVTPLQNGTYEIETEKESLEFDTVKFEATGSIIPPIAIRATKKVATNGEE
jgi:hypothetical protein